jgi:hypothetical protein
MNPRLLLSSTFLAGAALLGVPSGESGSLLAGAPGCEPFAPLLIEIISSDVSRGIAIIDYRVVPLIDALVIDSSLELPPGAVELSHLHARGEEVLSGDSFVGRAAVRLLESDARITLRASVSFMATAAEGQGNPDAELGLETAYVLRDLDWGDATSELDLPLVQSGEELTFDMPAIRTGGDQ